MEGSSGTTWVILGLLALGPRTGYEMKQVVDRSTRWFWAASYVSDLPELRRLEEAGLVQGGPPRRPARASAASSRSRPPAGTRSATGCTGGRYGWRCGTSRSCGSSSRTRCRPSTRSDFSTPAPRASAARSTSCARSTRGRGEDPFVDLVLRFGLDYCEWMVGWCERQEERLRREAVPEAQTA